MPARKPARPRTPATPAADAHLEAAAPARPRRPGAARRARRTEDAASAAVTIAPPTADEIRTRAYYLSLERRGAADPVADWLRAERDLVASRALTLAPGSNAVS